MVRRRIRHSVSAPARAAIAGIALTLLAPTLFDGETHAARLKAADAKAAYRDVLAILATGDRDAALEALYQLETGAVGDDEPWKEIEGFWRQKLRVIRDLVLEHPLDLMVPIVVLHHDAYEMYRERRRPLLASHSRTMASELAEIYADRARSHEAAGFSSWVLISFAAYLQESWSISQAAHYFDRALKLDPVNEFALISLAVAMEKSGDYEKALGYLDRLLAVAPDDPAIRLRRALCQARARPLEREAALAELEKLSASSGPAWVRSLAFQELARMHHKAGAGQTAEEVLRRGLEVLPDDQQLSVQLAAVIERHARGEARQILASVGPGEWGRDSPRQVYDLWPSGGLQAARGTMRAMMEDRLVSLGDGLRAPQAGGEAE